MNMMQRFSVCALVCALLLSVGGVALGVDTSNQGLSLVWMGIIAQTASAWDEYARDKKQKQKSGESPKEPATAS